MSLDRLISRVPHEATPDAMEVMRLSMLDWLACGIAGRGEPVAHAVRQMVLDEGGGGQASVFGGGKAPARGAALVNGTTSHALDYDDTHFAHIGHPSVVVVSAALAVGQASGASLAQVCEAALRGCEVSIRMGLRLGRAHYQVGFHQTATAGAFGAAYAAALLLHEDPAAHHVALSLASTRAAGLKSQFGTMGKPYNAGIAAATGVETAKLAGHFSAPTDPLDGTNGFFATHNADGTWDQPNGWLMTEVSHKFHACCHGLHATLEALADLPKPAPHDVVAVTVHTNPRWLTVCNIADPASGLEAKFSYAHVVALALSGHDTAAMGSYSTALAQDARLAALRDRVTVVGDPDIAETAAVVRLETMSGQLTARHDLVAHRGLAERRARVHQKAESLIGAGLVASAWDLLQDENATAEAFADLVSHA